MQSRRQHGHMCERRQYRSPNQNPSTTNIPIPLNQNTMTHHKHLTKSSSVCVLMQSRRQHGHMCERRQYRSPNQNPSTTNIPIPLNQNTMTHHKHGTPSPRTVPVGRKPLQLAQPMQLLQCPHPVARLNRHTHVACEHLYRESHTRANINPCTLILKTLLIWPCHF